MERIVIGDQMQLLDKYTIEEMGVPSLVLMERAGLLFFEAIKKEGFFLNKKFLILLRKREIMGRMVWYWHDCFILQVIAQMSVF